MAHLVNNPANRPAIAAGLQWCGTIAIVTMYALINMHSPFVVVAGLTGGVCFLLWSILEKNKPQMLVNIVSISFCLWGLYV